MYCFSIFILYNRHCGVNFQHTNHLPVRSEHMKLGQSAIPEDLRQVAEDMLGKHCPPSVVKLLINVMSGESITTKAVQNLRGAVMLRKFSDSTKGSEDTTAQQLLNYVKGKPGMSYAYLTATYDAAMGLVRVSKGMIDPNHLLPAILFTFLLTFRLRPCAQTLTLAVVGKKYENKAQYQPLPGLSSDQNIFQEQRSDEECKDKETESYVRALVKCLQLGDDEILLALGFATRESRLYHQKFPEVLGFDVKHGTNNERRPLFRLVGKTANNKNVPFMNVYLPSEMRFSFDWALNECTRQCLDNSSLSKTSLLTHDEDNQELNALHAILLSDDCIYGRDAKSRLCAWHKVRL